jgi:hypothetical protein
VEAAARCNRTCSRWKKNAVLKNSTSAENIQTKTGERCNANNAFTFTFARTHTFLPETEFEKFGPFNARPSCMHACML